MKWIERLQKEKVRYEKKDNTINECAIKRDCSPRPSATLSILAVDWGYFFECALTDTRICAVYYKQFRGGMCCLAQWNKHLSSAVPLNVRRIH